MIDPPVPRLAVIGGGCAGATTFIHLAAALSRPALVRVYEPRAELGRGVAYSTPDPNHRINVPAARMSVLPDEPEDFDRWLRASGLLAADPAALLRGGEAYPARWAFGTYVAAHVARAAETGPARLHHVRAQAVAIQRSGSGFLVRDAAGGAEPADLVVIAASHPPPRPPAAIARDLGDDSRLIADPWQPGALDPVGTDERVLIVGTALTMADVVASLDARGHRGLITAVSRRGLLSREHAAPGEPFGDYASAPPANALALLRAIRANVKAAAAAGVPWQDALDAVRIQAPQIWGALSWTERGRVVRLLRPFWDVHRYRVAPQPAAAIARRRKDGRLDLRIGGVVGVRPGPAGLAVSLSGRHGPALLEVDRLVLATGPGHADITRSNPALASLAAAGLARPDPVGLGLHVDADNHLLDAEGRPQPDLLVAGPLARGTVGELMGLPQVTVHARDVGQAVAARLNAWSERVGR